LFAAALLALAAPAADAQSNLIVNPGFSSGSTGWSTNCTIEIYAETVYGGTNASNNVTEIDKERCLHQDVAVVPGKFYTFSFRAARRTSGAPATVGVHVRVIGRQSGTQYINVYRTYTQSTWSYVTEDFLVHIPAAATDSEVRIRFNNYLTGGTYGTLLDDIVFQEDADAVMLPLQIGSFTAAAAEQGVRLDWTASNADQDGKHFEIERMVAGGA